MSIRTVLVDDSAQFLRVARSLLESEGLTVVDSVSTGADALRAAREHLPDVVVVDVGLGEESGFDVAKQLHRAMGGRIRVVLISARSEEDLRDFIEASPAAGFVPKSRFSAQAIVELLNGRDSGDAGVR